MMGEAGDDDHSDYCECTGVLVCCGRVREEASSRENNYKDDTHLDHHTTKSSIWAVSSTDDHDHDHDPLTDTSIRR